MRRLAALALVFASTTARADVGDKPATETATDDQLVLLNASARLASIGQIDRVRQALAQRGLLAPVSEKLQDTLEGRNVMIEDLEQIKDAVVGLDFANAQKLIEADEARILASAAGGDPLPALAQLSEMRGLIALGQDKPDDALEWFRAAYRFNPAQTPEKRFASPRVRSVVKKAHRDVTTTGKLRVDADPAEATFSIDGGKPQSIADKIELATGWHVVQIMAPGRKSYADMVEVHDGKIEKLEITLDKETKQDKAAKLIDATVAAPPGKERLKSVKGLSRITGYPRMLVVEEGADDHLTVRVYDVDSKKVSKPLELDGMASSGEIERKVRAALDPENMIEPSTVMVIERQHEKRWYERWYVWAGVGAVLGGGIIGYEYATRSPTSIRGF